MSAGQDSTLFDQLAERFLDAVRDGEEPDVEDWASRHPEHAEAIRELFPTILAMEEMKRADDSRPPRLSLGMGDRLGDFRIVREIGRGGMGVVYEAVQESLGRRVAVKVLPALGDVRRVRRFEREAKTAARLHHTNIVPIFGVGTQDGWHYYVMQVIRGVGLDAVVSWLRAESDDGLGAASEPAPPNDGAPEADRSVGPEDHALSIAHLVRALRTGSFRPASAPSTAASTDSSAMVAASGIEPEPLDGALEDLPPDPGPALDNRARYWRSVAWIGRQVASALAYAHAQGVLHRDVKPANLLIDARGVVWVTDFGLATANEGDGLTRSGDLLGTMQYMAPEQLRGDYDERSDVYALGLTLYELLTLRPAFRERDRGRLLESVARGVSARPSALRPGVPRDLETIVLHALQVEPRHRYANATELAEDLQNFLDDRPIHARRATALEHGWRWCRRNRAVAALGAVAVLGVLSAGVAGWVGQVRIRDALRRETELSKAAQAASERAERHLKSATRAFEEIFATLAGPPRLTLIAAASSEASLETESATGDAETAEADFAWASSGTQVSVEQAALLERLLSFYAELATDAGDSMQLTVETASATRRVADIQLQLGRPADAVASYERALSSLSRAVASGVSYDPVLAASLRNDLAQARLEAGNPREARDELLNVVGDLQADERIAARFERARAHELLGGLARFAPPGEHRRGPRSGRGRRQPPGEGPEDAPRGERPPRGLPAEALAPDARQLQGPPRGGPDAGAPPDGVLGPLGHFAAAWQLNRSLVAERPDEPAFVLAASRTARLYARVQRLQRQWGSGLALRVVRRQIGEARGALRALVDEHPGEPAYRAELAASLIEWASPEESKDLEAERESVAEGLEIARALHTANPDWVAYRRLHRRALLRSAELELASVRRLRRTGVAEQQRPHFEAARSHLEAALTLFPGDGMQEAERFERRQARGLLLMVLFRLGDEDEARRQFELLRRDGDVREQAFEQVRGRMLGGGERRPRSILRERLRDR